MNTYRLRIQKSRVGFGYPWGVPDLDTNALVAALPGASIREFSGDGHGRATLELDLERPSHVDALNAILAVLQFSGYIVLNGWITEWATSTAEGAMAGLLGGSLVGTRTRDGWGMLIATGVGMLAGSIMGSNVKRVEKMFQIQPNSLGGLSWVEVPLEGDERSGPAWA